MEQWLQRNVQGLHTFLAGNRLDDNIAAILNSKRTQWEKEYDSLTTV